MLVRSFQNDLLPNKVPLLFNAEISFYYTWFQDYQIKGSCGQDLYRALHCLLCVWGGARVRVVTEVKRELVKIHYFLWQTLALAVHVALVLPLHLISFINTRHRSRINYEAPGTSVTWLLLQHRFDIFTLKLCPYHIFVECIHDIEESSSYFQRGVKSLDDDLSNNYLQPSF